MPRTYDLEVKGLSDAQISVKAAGDVTSDHLEVRPDGVATYHILVTSKTEPAEPKDIVFSVSDTTDKSIAANYESVYITQRER
jgi:hypothetical protein